MYYSLTLNFKHLFSYFNSKTWTWINSTYSRILLNLKFNMLCFVTFFPFVVIPFWYWIIWKYAYQTRFSVPVKQYTVIFIQESNQDNTGNTSSKMYWQKIIVYFRQSIKQNSSKWRSKNRPFIHSIKPHSCVLFFM